MNKATVALGDEGTQTNRPIGGLLFRYVWHRAVTGLT
jgi:hypothetical protein